MIKIFNLKSKPWPASFIYIGRANTWLNLPESKWHNPFVMKNESQRLYVVSQYFQYILKKPELLKDLHELHNKTLGCWCHNDEPGHKLCHGDVLRELSEYGECGLQMLIENLNKPPNKYITDIMKNYLYYKPLIIKELEYK